MTLFWTLAVALCVVAAAFIILPLYVRRKETSGGSRTTVNLGIYEERLAELQESFDAGDINEEEFDHLKTELQKNLVSDAEEQEPATPGPAARPFMKVPATLAVLVPVFALIAYADWGLSWGAIEDYQIARDLNNASPHSQQDMGSVVRRLEKSLASQPENHQGWFLLGQSYMSMGMYNKAADAFAHLRKTYPDDTGLLTYLAESLYLADDRQYTGRVREVVETTLEKEPTNITMLEIRGMGALQDRRPEDAIRDFRAAIAAGAQGRRAEMINNVIARLQTELGISGEQASEPKAQVASMEQGTQRELSVRVELKEGLDVSGDETVFVYARALEGPPMPLAVQRMNVSALPQVVSLDESMAMMPGMGLANFDKVQVVARISTSGIANVSPDDFQAVSGPVDLTNETSLITLKISERVGNQ